MGTAVFDGTSIQGQFTRAVRVSRWTVGGVVRSRVVVVVYVVGVVVEDFLVESLALALAGQAGQRPYVQVNLDG